MPDKQLVILKFSWHFILFGNLCLQGVQKNYNSSFIPKTKNIYMNLSTAETFVSLFLKTVVIIHVVV